MRDVDVGHSGVALQPLRSRNPGLAITTMEWVTEKRGKRENGVRKRRLSFNSSG